MVFEFQLPLPPYEKHNLDSLKQKKVHGIGLQNIILIQ